MLRAFRLTINSNKSSLLHSTQFTHLGLTVDLVWQKIDVPDHKRAKLHAMSCTLADYAASHRQWVSKQSLVSMVVLPVLLSPTIALARSKLLPLYDALA